MTKFEILFFNPESKERRAVEVTVTSEEAMAAAAYPDPELVLKCMALRHGYQQVPDDWYHYSDRIKQIVLQ
jgi:hypothetical protein